MKIAFVTPEFVTESSFDGGLANYLDKISLVLLERNHNIFIFVASNKDEIFSHKNRIIIRVNTTSGIKNITKLKLLKNFSHPINWAIQSYKLNQSIKKFHAFTNFDIIQYSSYTATALFAPKNINSVIRISSFQPLMNKHYEYNIDKKVEKIEEYLELLSLKRTKKVFGPSQLLANELHTKINKDIKIIESPLIMLKNKDFDYTIYNKELENKQYLLFFGTLGLLKGTKEIADILFKLLEKYQQLYFVFIGSNTIYNGNLMFEYIKLKAIQYKDRCIHINSLQRKELFPIIKNSYAVILPSRIDNFPNTCTEAMSLKKIVVGTKGTSFEQLIIDTKNGFLCKPYNPNSLFNTIDKVLNLNEKEKKQIELMAFKTIQRLNPNKIAFDHEVFYTLIKGSHLDKAYTILINFLQKENPNTKISLFGFNSLAEILYAEYEKRILFIFDNNFNKQLSNKKIVKFDSTYDLNNSIIVITALNKKAIYEIKSQINQVNKKIKIIHI